MRDIAGVLNARCPVLHDDRNEQEKKLSSSRRSDRATKQCPIFNSDNPTSITDVGQLFLLLRVLGLRLVSAAGLVPGMRRAGRNHITVRHTKLVKTVTGKLGKNTSGIVRVLKV